MSGAAHTPGPWAFDAEEMAQGADDIFTITIRGPGPDDGGLMVASICAFEILSESLDGCEYVRADAPAEEKLAQAKANTRLIAAAPELLEALREVLKHEKWHAAMADEVTPAARAAIKKADAAILKATGSAL